MNCYISFCIIQLGKGINYRLKRVRVYPQRRIIMDVRELAVQKKRELKGFLTVGTKYELKDAHDLSVAYTQV